MSLYGKNVWITLGIALILCLGGFGYYFFFWSTSYTTPSDEIEKNKEISRDVAKYIEGDPRYAEARSLYNSRRYEDAFKAYSSLAEQELNKEVKESLYLYAAAALMIHDPVKGADYYRNFLNDTENLESNRAYALLRVEQYARGVSDISVLRPFLSDVQTITATSTDDEVLFEINKKIFALYPFGITAARLARSELARAIHPDEAKYVYDKYKDFILRGREEMLQRVGLRHMAANCILNEYYLSRDLEKYKLATSSDTRQLIDLAYTTGKLHSPQITQQYIALDYAEYMAMTGDQKKAYDILLTLKNEGVSPIIVSALKQTGSQAEYPHLSVLAKTDEQFKKSFSEFGW